ncbi:MAG: hypothetical protein J6X44_06120 [Thermoguttaceae bacterium]|nr:hypothetical protein [Thermoguttaceae bacterium]
MRKGGKKESNKGREQGREEERAAIGNRLIQAGFSPEALSRALNLEGGPPAAR